MQNELFSKEKSVMVETARTFSSYITKYLEIIFIDSNLDTFEDELARIEHPTGVRQNELFIKLALENIGKYLNDPAICMECPKGLTTHENALKHVKAAHDKKWVDLLEYERRHNAPVLRAIEQVTTAKNAIIDQKESENGQLRQQNTATTDECISLTRSNQNLMDEVALLRLQNEALLANVPQEPLRFGAPFPRPRPGGLS